MSKDALKALVALGKGINSYSDSGHAKKEAMHKQGRAFLKRLAGDLNLPDDSFEVRSNQGGIAVSGEVTLHGESIYVQLSEWATGEGGVSVLYRSCRGRKDYTGGHNHHSSCQQLQDGGYPSFVAQCKLLMESPDSAPPLRRLRI